MLLNPRVGQTVTVRYNAKARRVMFLHGRQGTVAVVPRRTAGRCGPINVGVVVAGVLYVVPRGNLFAEARAS